MNTVSFKLPPDIDRALTRIAKTQGMSKSALIRLACRELVDRQAEPLKPSLVNRMGGIVGAVEGPGDLSTNHEYLDGYGQ